MKRYKPITRKLISSVICGCLIGVASTIGQTTDGNLTKNAEWLIGTWANQTTSTIIYESWWSEAESGLTGMSYTISGNDTSVFERISLFQVDTQLIYSPIVSDQNRGEAVQFYSTHVTSSEMKFENPNHDFPQVITYKQITPDSLVAAISGLKNGKYARREFPMKRID